MSNFSYSFHKPFRIRDVDDNEQNQYFFLSEYNSDFRRINQEYTINYKTEIGKHAVELLGGYQRILEPFSETYVQAEGWKISDQDIDGNGDLDDKESITLLDEDFNTLNAFRAAEATFSGSGTNSEYTLESNS